MRKQVECVLRSRASNLEKLEQLVWFLNIPYREALNIVETQRRPVVTRAFEAENFTFGVEIECINVNKAILVERLREKGVQAFVQGYNHNDNDTYYKIVTDGSLTGRDTAEIVSPILKGAKGLESLRIVCETLQEIGATVNRSCGLHVHIGASTFDIHRWRNLYVNYARLEPIIDGFLPKSRRANNNTFCKSISLLPMIENEILRCNDTYDIRRVFGSRYYKVNMEAFFRHNTIEFRQHSGTIDYKKISMWLSFLQKLVTFSKNSNVENVTTIEQIPFLSESEKAFFKARQEQLRESMSEAI